MELDTSDLDPNEPVLYQGSVFDSDDDEDYLVDPKRGPFQDNLKKRIKGFDEEEGRICPLVDRKSALLFDVVQTLEEEQINTSVKILQRVKHAGPIPLEWIQEYVDPNAVNKPDFFDQWYIRMVDEEKSKKSREDRIVDAELAKQRKLILGNEETVASYAIPFDHGWSREVVVRIHPTPVHEVSDTNPMSSIGEVFYRDPSGNKIRSMKQIAMTLEKRPISGISIRNFTFAKAPIGVSDPKKENIRKIISGRQSNAISPYRPPNIKQKKIMKDASLYETQRNYPPIDMTQTSVDVSKHKGSSSRRSIQPPKRYATGQAYIYPEKRSKMAGTKKDVEYHSDHEMEMGMLPPKYPRGKEDTSLTLDADGSLIRRRGRPPKNMGKGFEGGSSFNGDDDSALFQISAFHNHSQSTLFQGIEDAAAQATDEMHYGGGMSHGMMDQEPEQMGGQEAGEREHGTEELLPCSIRCPGMTGEIPTLQCKRCLCLYHPECLALPPNLNFRDFLCANCEVEPGHGDNVTSSPSVSQGHGPGFEAMKRLLNKSGKSGTKKPPPPLLPAFTKMSSGGKFPSAGMGGAGDSSAGKMFRMIAPKMGHMMQPPLGRGLNSTGSKNTLPKMTPSKMTSSLLRQPDDSMSISPITMKRGRGRPPKNTRLLPNLSSNRNLTITPISMRGPRVGPPPPLINLTTPMGNTRGMVPPYMPGRLKGAQKLVPPVLNKPRQQGAISSLTMTSSSSGGGSRIPDAMFNLKEMSRKPTSTQNLNIKGLGLPPFRRYPQSVVSIGNKKFVAVSRATGEVQTSGMHKGKSTTHTNKKLLADGPTVEATTITTTPSTSDPGKQSPPGLEPENEVGEDVSEDVKPVVVEDSPSSSKTPHKFDSDKEVVEQIFKYLNVKDLIRASRVCQLWNTAAMDVSLWKVVRMKNHRISDIETFTQFLKKQQTELVDFRKMISAGEMNWDTLFQSLSDVPSVRQVILGPRSSELMSSLSQHCPNIEVVNS